MKLKTLLTTIVLGLSLTTASYANDINSSWSINTLKGQALVQIVKKAQLKKFNQKTITKKNSTYITKDIEKTRKTNDQ